MLFYWRKNGIPGPTPLPVLGNLLPYFLKVIIEVETDRVAKYGPLYESFEGFIPVLTIADPKLVDEVFIRNFSTFADNKNYFFHPIVRQGILTAVGERWKRSKKILGPAFTLLKIRATIPSVDASLDRWVKNLNETIDVAGGCFDMNIECSRLFIDNSRTTLFGLDSNDSEEGRKFSDFCTKLGSMQLWRILIATFAPDFMLEYTGYNIFSSELFNYVFGLVEVVLGDKQATTGPETRASDLTSILLRARSEDGSGLTLDEVKGNVFQFFFASFETMAGTVSHACYALAHHPEIQDRLREELLGTPDVSRENKESYLWAFMQEVFRYYPQATRLDRYANSDITFRLDGKEIKMTKGSKARLPIY